MLFCAFKHQVALLNKVRFCAFKRDTSVEAECIDAPQITATTSDLFELAYTNNQQQRIHSSTIMDQHLSSNDEDAPEIDI